MRNSKYPSDFRQWHTEMVQDVFGLKKSGLIEEWAHWKSKMPTLTAASKETIAILFRKNADYLELWSEANIKARFIHPLLDIADLNTDEFSIFAENKLTATLHSIQQEPIRLIGIPDLIYAKGIITAKSPFFCLHEYKPQRGNLADARGQLLTAMLVTNQLNKEAKSPISPIYGSYTIGKEWLFVLLKDNQYMVSKTYLMNELEDVLEIVGLLKALRVLFEAKLTKISIT
jgi:hypothetical protein